MSQSPLLNYSAGILDAVVGGIPADTALRERFAHGRRLDPAEKRQVCGLVFAYLRWLKWLDPKAPTQMAAAEAAKLQAKFDGNPSFVKREALVARAVPGWAASEMELPEGYLRHLQREPALWIRPRLDRAHDTRKLSGCSPADLEALNPIPDCTALRYSGLEDLFTTDLFRSGAFEIQDLASQLTGHACAPKPGESWWDACAGEGGKTLHLADLMRNKGLVWATDRSERRLSILRKRAARAGIFNYRAAAWEGLKGPPMKTKFDGVLVDAPCSGVGTWQRNPHMRWTVSPQDVRELAGVQLRLLGLIAGSVKPGGRLIYSVCTLTRSETTEVAELFSSAHPEFEPKALPIAKDGAARLTLQPQDFDSNGMYLASWIKKR